MMIDTLDCCHTLVRSLLLSAFAVTLFVAPATSSRASEALTPADRMLVLCNRFADLSVQWTIKAEEEVCSVELSNKQGSLWSKDSQSYYQWCLKQTKEAVLNARLAAQRATIETCRADRARAQQAVAQRPDHQACFLYAKRAFAQAKEAQALECGFDGKRWLTDFSFHREQCADLMTLNTIEAETQQRQDALQRCEAKRGKLAR